MAARPISLALRVTLLFAAAAAIVFPVFGWFIDRSIDSHFLAEDSRELELIARAARKVLSAPPSASNMARPESRLDDILVGHHSASLLIVDAQDRAIYASPGPDLSPPLRGASPDPNHGATFEWRDADRTYRVLVHRIDHDSARPSYGIAVAVPIDHHLQFLERFRRTLWLMTAAGIALMSLFGWIAVRRGHTPLHQIVAQIRRISADRLDRRIAPSGVPAELTDLATSFNEMLGRMEDAFNRLSNYSADIAHELRTPVANLMTQTQVALSQARSVDQYREVLYSNIEEYERMAQMIGDMLFLAQADNGLYRPQTASVDLANEVRELFDYYEAWAEERGVSLTLDGAAEVSGDKLMLRRALNNLIANAIRHTPAGKTVRVQLQPAADNGVSISVENPGQTIAPEHLARLFERFYRVDASRQRGSEGAGLGLAIVKSIVDAHGGQVSVTSRDGLTRFVINLPAAKLRSLS